MAVKAEQITVENTSLHSELRKALEMQIRSVPSANLRQNKSVNVQEVTELKEQLQMVNNERDAFRNMLKKTSMGLEVVQMSEQVGTNDNLMFS